MILDGKKLADDICQDLIARVDKLRIFGITPCLIVVTTGESDAGAVYAKSKEKMARKLGINIITRHYDYLTHQDFAALVQTNMPIIFQMPLVGNVCYDEIAQELPCEMDVEGISYSNVADLAIGEGTMYVPCTPAAVMALLDRNDIDVASKTVCMIGRSNTVGRPLARLLEHRNATVILCHSKTRKAVLMQSMKMADVIITATGHRNILTAADVIDWGVWLNDKVLIDVGINRDEHGKVCGDFEPDIFHFCKAYTPVPGGVGPVTTAILMSNVIKFYEGSL